MGIGSSLVAACLGLADSMSPLEAYASILGLDPEEHELIEKPQIKRGMFMEPAILAWLCHEAELELHPSPGMLECPGIPWLLSTPDGLGRCKKTGRWFALEVKKRDDATRGNWTPEPPVHIQLQHDIQMLCLGIDEGYIACDFGRGPLHIVRRVRNDLLLEPALEALQEWRTKHVLCEEPPALTVGDGAARVWKLLHPKDNGGKIELDEAGILAASEYDAASEELRASEARKEAALVTLREKIGDNTFGVMPDGSGFSFKTQVSNYKATEARTVETRVLRRIKKVV